MTRATELDESVAQDECDRLRESREYFEEGCACIHTEKTLQPCPASMADSEAVAFYEQHCVCSRNYVEKQGERA